MWMARYRQLCRESFVGLVRGYLAHVYLKEAEEPLMQLQDSLGCPKVGSALTRLKALRKQVGCLLRDGPWSWQLLPFIY